MKVISLLQYFTLKKEHLLKDHFIKLFIILLITKKLHKYIQDPLIFSRLINSYLKKSKFTSFNPG